MRRELVLLAEMIEAAEQAHTLVAGIDVEALDGDRQRRDALLWNLTVLGEAAAQLDNAVKARFPDVKWARPADGDIGPVRPRPAAYRSPSQPAGAS